MTDNIAQAESTSAGAEYIIAERARSAVLDTLAALRSLLKAYGAVDVLMQSRVRGVRSAAEQTENAIDSLAAMQRRDIAVIARQDREALLRAAAGELSSGHR